MSEKAFNKIAEGLKDALEMAREADIVERLRKHVNDRGGPSIANGAWEMMLEAADEIERLRDQSWKYLQECVRQLDERLQMSDLRRAFQRRKIAANARNEHKEASERNRRDLAAEVSVCGGRAR